MRTLFTSLMVLVLGVSLTAWATDGFRALTSEQARRAAIAVQPMPIPDVELLMANGETHSLRQLVAEQGGSTIIGFFYSSCRSICITLGNDFRQLQQRLQEQNLEEQVHLLSISFDPETDTASILHDYEQRMGAQEGTWHITAAKRPEDLPALLSAFGIRVIDDKRGGFIHNSAFHIVNAEGELEAIVGLGRPQTALRRALGEPS